jgi:cytochrome c-type biogenesis protein CcmH/NrfG
MTSLEEIGRYVDGEMDAGERKAFELQMQADATLRDDVALYKEVTETLRNQLHPDDNELALRLTLEQTRKEYFKPKAKVITLRHKQWMVAAAAVLFFIVMIWSPWKQSLYRQYASVEMSSIAERGTATDSLRLEATGKFNAKKFTEAIPVFETFLKQQPDNVFMRFYYAVALLEAGQIQKSRQELTKLFEGSSLFKYDAAFYMALSYLKEKDKAGCQKWLRKIPSDASVYSKALELLEKL